MMPAPCEACQANPEIHQLDVDGAMVDIYACSEHAGEVARGYLLGRKMMVALTGLRTRLGLWAVSDRISTVGQLAAVLGLGDGGFVESLMLAMQRADADNLVRLRAAFPDVSIAWEAWYTCPIAPTPGQLWEQIRVITERWWDEQGLVMQS